MTATWKWLELFMTDITHNLIGKIDDVSIAVLSEIDTISRDFYFDFFIVGAMARDILLQHAHGLPTIRASLDIDIGVFVSGWDRFLSLKEALVNTGKFKSTGQVQRLLYEDERPLDIVPFGGVADDSGSISWPPEHAIEMSVMGFNECYRHTETVLARQQPDLIVKVVSLAGLAILKLVSWDDNLERRGKDAYDLFVIMRNYIEAGNLDRFFEVVDILKEEGSDYDLSSAHFLGLDMAGLADKSTNEKLTSILKREAASTRGHQIAMNVLRQSAFQNESYERVVTYFDALLRGLVDHNNHAMSQQF
jgi:predicted nucleotidyltransferase